jgi:hypothetical protein
MAVAYLTPSAHLGLHSQCLRLSLPIVNPQISVSVSGTFFNQYNETLPHWQITLLEDSFYEATNWPPAPKEIKRTEKVKATSHKWTPLSLSQSLCRHSVTACHRLLLGLAAWCVFTQQLTQWLWPSLELLCQQCALSRRAKDGRNEWLWLITT